MNILGRKAYPSKRRCLHFLIGFLIVLGLTGLSTCRSGSEPANGKLDSSPSGKAGAVYETGVIHLKQEQVLANGIMATAAVEENIAPTIAAIGWVKIRSGDKAEVFSPFPGRLVGSARLPQIGEFVKKGQNIADVEQQFMASEKLQLETSSIQLQSSMEQAQQELDLRRKELDRARQLYDGGAIPLKEVQTSEFELKQAESKLEGARRAKGRYEAAQSTVNSQPRRTPIVAPISGLVLVVDATMGQQVDTSKSLMAIADLTTVWVEAAVHERDLPQIRQARSAEIFIPESEERYTGNLVTIGNIVDPENRTVPVTFSVDNRATRLKVEMSVEVRIPAGPPVAALLIPYSALLLEENASSVYVEIEPCVYQKRTVEPGQRNDQLVVITSGLQRGEKVVSVGAQMLRSESLKREIPVEEEEKEKEEKER